MVLEKTLLIVRIAPLYYDALENISLVPSSIPSSRFKLFNVITVVGVSFGPSMSRILAHHQSATS